MNRNRRMGFCAHPVHCRPHAAAVKEQTKTQSWRHVMSANQHANQYANEAETSLKLFHAVSVFCFGFYRAMHCSAKRGIAIACRLSVRPSVCLSVCLSVTLVNCDHIGWNSSKIISSLVSLGCSFFATPTWLVCSKGNTPKFWPKVTHPLLIWASETFDRKLRPNGYR